MQQYDAIVIGSGVGAAHVAYPLVHAGWRVLMIERGEWLERGAHNWSPESVRDLSPHYDRLTPYELHGDDHGTSSGVHCVGGPSIYYGGVSLRYRERDFIPTPEERAAGAEWPYTYAELEPYYAAAERIIGVAGVSGGDPTEPPRSTPFPQALPPLSRIGQRIADASERLGHSPFRLPLAINYGRVSDRSNCIGCSTCDCYPCAIGAKNDVASAILPRLMSGGLEIVAGMAVRRILMQGRRARGVEAVEVRTGRRHEFSARNVILSAGALATPHILLASALDQAHVSGSFIGRMLMRHANSIVFGLFPDRLDAAREFHKQVGVNDFYFGHRTVSSPAGKLGTIQQIHSPPPALVRAGLPGFLGTAGSRILGHMTGLIVVANDEPQYTNTVSVRRAVDALDMPRALVHHRYSARDKAARNALSGAAAKILREAGAITTFSLPVRTFSHGLGSVRMGSNEYGSAVDPGGRLRGSDNVFVADASVLPSSAGVNPSLTIAATALRTGCLLAGTQATLPSSALVAITAARRMVHV